jgi:Insertion element 4 transposase N-terminal/Transposase DDE domain
MARTKASLGQGVRLADYLSVGLLGRVYPAAVIGKLLDQHDVNTQRQRSLPALVTSYYCIALSLYPQAAYEEVYSVVAEGLAERSRGSVITAPAKSSISAARQRIGFAPLKDLVSYSCIPLADPATQPHAFYAGLRLVAIDGSSFDLPDEAGNVAEFGRPGGRKGVSAFPQAKCAALIECATHAIFAATCGAYKSAEWSLCQQLLPSLRPDMLCLADRGFAGYARWQEATASGAQLLWRCKSNAQLPVLQRLPDGSFLSALYPDEDSRWARRKEIKVRVIEYSLPSAKPLSSTDARPSGHHAGAASVQPPQRYRLITTLLDAKAAPALELALLYHERWEVEAAFDELKTHLIHSRPTLRSKTPDGVRQEFYGWVLAHYAVCWLMHQTASEHRLRQRVLSFTGHANLLRRVFPRSGEFPPWQA